MFVRKNKITRLIKKEKERERLRCEKESARQIKNLKSDLENKHALIVKELNAGHKKTVLELGNEIRRLKSEIDRNYSTYMDIRIREKAIKQLTAEMEAEVNRMVTKIHESIQPFYRTMSKVESTGRKSDKKHDKVERIFHVVS